MAQPEITIYSSKFCGYCVAAERLFQNKDLEYKLIKVDEDPSKFEHMVKITGRRTVPQIFIGDHHVGGFDDLSAINQTGELKTLLKSA
ncbi:MAG: glutaredoxin 3 [Gammaproteobacteria bacterium]|nr:glutaredoxin 3 [Gammaproteobacteria bacterium]